MLSQHEFHILPSLVVGLPICHVRFRACYAHSILGGGLIYACSCLVAVTVVINPLILARSFVLDTLFPLPAVHGHFRYLTRVLVHHLFFARLVAKSAEHQLGVVEVFAHLARHGACAIALSDGNRHGYFHFLAQLFNGLPHPI